MRKTSIFILISSILLAISTATIGLQYMWTDEVYSFQAAKMILEKGQPLYDSGLFYGRAPLYHHLLAYSMKIFGINEFGSRILNIPFVIGTAILVGILVYQLIKTVKIGKNKKLWISLLSGLLYYMSNFATSMMRETRMYSMSTFFFVLCVFLLYKAFIKPNKKGLIDINWLDLRFNLYYLLAFIPSFYIAYDTQPINIILGLGLIIFFGLNAFIQNKYKQLFVAIGILIAGFVATYLKFGTWNVLVVFSELSPNWALTLTPFYYSILTVRNLPFVILTVPAAIYILFKNKDIFLTYLVSISAAFLGFLSLQTAQHERYWQVMIPILIILSIYTLAVISHEFKQKWIRISLLIFVVLSLSFHIYLAGKEYLEIDTYTPHSLAIYKKLQFKQTFTYLTDNEKQGDILIADMHSAYTLYEKGYKVDYLLLPDDNVNWVWGTNDLYFDIPLLKYSDLKNITSANDGYIVIRDPGNFGSIDNVKVEGFNRPTIYKF